jgi:two-component system CheB/CheR fusion protein
VLDETPMMPTGDRTRLSLLAAIIHDSDDAIATKTLDSVVTSWNRGAERIFGYTAAEIVGRPITILFPPDRLGEETEFLLRLSRGEHVDHYETVRLRKDGRLIDISVTLSPLRDEAGTIFGISKIARDISLRKRAETVLREQLEFWRVALASIGDGVIVTDAARQVIFINHEAELLTGWSENAAAGRPLADIFVIIHEGTRRAVEGPVDRAMANRTAVRLVNHAALVSRDGRVRPIDACVAPILAADGTVVGAVLVFRDAAERRRVETERARVLAEERTARTAAERVNRTKDEFLAMLAHELRNPLAAILNGVATLDRIGTMSPDAVRVRGIVRRQTEHLAGVLEELLDVARIGQRKIELQRQLLDMRSVVQQAFEADCHRFEARRQRAVVTPSSEPVIVLGDPVRLQQIVSNLLTNAAKYTPPDGVVTITVAVEDNDAVVRVRDTGIGIPSERLDEIFDLFTQVATPKGRAESGLGIGLALAKQLTELHGGSITALSEGPGKGSEFILRLPRLPGAAVEGEPAVPSALAARHRLLIIDDDRDSRDVLAMSLEMDGHRVFAAGSGREGLEIALVERPTVAIVDIGMSDIDGREVARRLRQAMGAEIMLIAFSGYGQPEDRRRSLEAGFDAHVVKPATSEEILAVLAGRVPVARPARPVSSA